MDGDVQVLLGLSGVLIVGLSVLGSMGICSAVGVKSTLIIVEVIPFLVLAVCTLLLYFLSIFLLLSGNRFTYFHKAFFLIRTGNNLLSCPGSELRACGTRHVSEAVYSPYRNPGGKDALRRRSKFNYTDDDTQQC